jgi:hypothetical protein
MARRSSRNPLTRPQPVRPSQAAGFAGHPSRRSRRGREVTLVSRAAFCVLAGISEAQLARWEQEALIAPTTASVDQLGSERLYDTFALRRARLIRTLADELDVNLPGIDVILHLLDQLAR